MKMKFEKPFLSIDEQIKHLKENRNLKIINKKKLKTYLSYYNFQNFINAYNDPFMMGFRRSNNLFIDGVNENAIIDLFNFDRTVSNLLLSNIQNIERMFNTAFCYVVAKELCNYEYEFGDIYNHTEIIFKQKWLKNAKDIFDDIYERFKSTDLFKKYSKDRTKIPIWSYGIYINYGQLNKLFGYLQDNLQKEIIKFNFKIFKNIDQFLACMETLKNVRNRCCHNNVVYNLKIRKHNQIINRVINKKTKHSSVGLYDIVVLIDNINNKNNYENNLKKIFLKKANKYIFQNKNIINICKEEIKKIINYKDEYDTI